MKNDYKTITLAGGRITCRQCAAQSKRTGVQCKAGVKPHQRVCKWHGGLSTGPKTPEGRQRCAEAKTVHGNETGAIRKERQAASVRLQELEELARSIGLIRGPKTPGRKAGSKP